MRERTGAARVGEVISQAAVDAGEDVAADAADRALVVVGELTQIEEMLKVDQLLTRIWGGEAQDAVSVNMMRALAHTGNYVAGAFRDSVLVGASVAFVWGGSASLHSHVTGVAPERQARGVGFALKTHQRSWAASRGITRITWTYDPLIRRNAWFNLVKLGARAEAYRPDFYGPMDDGINTGDATDRCFVVWPTDDGEQRAALDVSAAHVLLTEDDGGEPVVAFGADGGVGADGAVLLCQVPRDAVEMRWKDPALGRRWRLALRDTMGRAMHNGYVTSWITEDGHYVLTKEGEETPG